MRNSLLCYRLLSIGCCAQLGLLPFSSSCPSAGIALIGHQVRRAIVLDPATRLPRLEDSDEPLEKFKAACTQTGLQLRVLSSRETCSNRDSDPMVLLAVGGPQARLADLPLLPSES